MPDTMLFKEAAKSVSRANHAIAFTGAGISVESGMPPFRGTGGLWSRYDSNRLDIQYFLDNPKESWEVIRDIFYEDFGTVEPNDAHRALATMEERGLLKAVITQNVDNLHQQAGSRVVHEFHGSCSHLVCLGCQQKVPSTETDLKRLPPMCDSCGGVLKPDFIFFGEGIPEPAQSNSFHEAETADLVLVIGTSGEVTPACLIPELAKKRGAVVVEINVEPSKYQSAGITDIFLEGPATECMNRLLAALDG